MCVNNDVNIINVVPSLCVLFIRLADVYRNVHT